jgi:2-polyprenyl-6-methoxyphenol hydroxylase-like FAD-dependent oxidoreductase
MSTDSATVVLIIGGGLGGLALAQLLLQSSSSIKVVVFERDQNENSREQGYCIGLDSMGLDVLHKIQVLDDLLSDESGAFYSLSYFRFINKYLENLFALNAGGTKLIYREDLRRALLTNIDVQWNKRFSSYKIVDDGIEANFEDGTIVHGTILIGCDGAKSLVRAQLIPEFKRNDLRIINIGGTVEQNDEMKKIQELTKDSLVRIFGKQGHTLLILPFRQLWMWALSWPEKENHEERNISSIQLIDKARQYFQDDEIVRLIELSSSSTFIGPFRMHSALCLKQNPFPNHPRVTLLGDAAHPMTTHAGKGANTAFADADDLANLILNPSSSSLSEYEQKMFKRGFTAVQMSLTSTNMIHFTGWQAFLRDCIFSIIRYTMTLINVIAIPFRLYKKKRD